MPAITDLPVELLQIIAGRCTALDILALSRTCRIINEACDTAAVFRMSFQLYLPELTSATFGNKAALVHFMDGYIHGPNKPCQRNEGPKMTWLCLAMAVARLPGVEADLEKLAEPIASTVKVCGKLALTMRRPPQLSEDTKAALQGLIALLSTLPIWGYTTACNSGVAAILDNLCPSLFSRSKDLNTNRIDQCIGGENPLQFAFCLVLSKLEKWCQSRAHDLSINLPVTNSYIAIIKKIYDGNTLNKGYDKFQNSWIGRQTHALLLIELIARNIYWDGLEIPNPRNIEFIGSWYFESGQEEEEDVEHGTWMRATSLRARFPLPTPSLISVRGKKGRYFYPFAGDGWWSWYTTRVRDLANEVVGEWCGSFAYSLRPRARMGRPITICFRKTNTDGDTYSLEASDGVDDIGPFSLLGEVNTSPMACTVRLRMQYPSTTMEWRGLVTPLGICGGCYNYIPTEPQTSASRAIGYFWLWKKEWRDTSRDDLWTYPYSD
ncbi:hypothetical protein F5Y00DRAFT_226163 [Daldinia vernicosa]|uniref:uncharacterized protein n=1 Tax=Daldinia vernicosa TaxID=114800 RepID=UPI0020088EEC|nr:uncharacterized protein F5Y00DRAFT_226163 [Daldinia vernicosa]KAI0852821.1 hypothetical protein F5Y00DRAFT_226163 [Daldinia vernicosa]